MREHEYFRELTSLAVLGDLSATELAELTAHLRECVSCQSSCVEFAELANYQLPLGDRRSERFRVPSGEAFREVALRRLSEEGLRISPEAFRGPIGWKKRLTERVEDLRWTLHAQAAYLGICAALLSIVVVAGLLVRHNVARRHEIEELRSNLLKTKEAAAQFREKVSEPAQTPLHAAANTEHLEQRLADATARAARLDLEHQQDVVVIRSLEAKIEQFTSANNRLTQSAHGSDAELADLRSQLEQSRAALADREAKLVASQFQIAELSNQLKTQESALEREQQFLAAGRDIRDVVGARNLHIIDVHDMDARGESRPFGRVFLTEGKRLIFYAYDLDAARGKNASFQAWGQREEGSKATVNLGLLYMDDQKQSRWALKVEDPNLLKAINSIFVTLEPHGGANKPTGKKLMYAYLRNPINHP
jgi:hypothetical protein